MTQSFFYQNKSVLIINYAETDQQLNLILKVLGLKATYWQETNNKAKYNFRTFSEIGKRSPVRSQSNNAFTRGRDAYERYLCSHAKSRV